ncbi:histidine phosphatase family protein [Thiolapillus brandeum]|uniref:Histidine phosphatase family protein n=1 Tax=Thiolapillus brandeum TaxID=1076588 RepID=A0A7U6GGX7_9GAMM|nr:histidine phosphatase family protein [Thiolapillus brandeum]BAO43395.1 hypothetical protein TBH_C0450 [Thiolapillus brandeum]
MAERGRFPVLYWGSILLLLLMLAFSGWWWYRSTIGSCDNLLDDPVTRAYVQRMWKNGRITVLMLHTDRCRDGEGQHCIEGLTAKGEADAKDIGAGMKRLFPGSFDLYSSKVDRAAATARLAFGRSPEVVPWLGEDCEADLQEQLVKPHKGNQVMVTHSTCLGLLTDGKGDKLIPFKPAGHEDCGLAVFLLRPEDGGIPKVLACAWPGDWGDAAHG